MPMSRQSVAKAHQKIQELSGEPQYHTPVSHYGTDYTFRKAQKKDPLKQVLRSYFPMQEEKDHRVYGASDGAIRGNMFRQVQERWLEWQKLFLSIIPLPEVSAARAMPLLFRTVPNPELHNGQALEVLLDRRVADLVDHLDRLAIVQLGVGHRAEQKGHCSRSGNLGQRNDAQEQLLPLQPP